jgi:hypothetical protein
VGVFTMVEGETRIVDSLVILVKAAMTVLSGGYRDSETEKELVDEALTAVFRSLTEAHAWNALLER